MKCGCTYIFGSSKWVFNHRYISKEGETIYPFDEYSRYHSFEIYDKKFNKIALATSSFKDLVCTCEQHTPLLTEQEFCNLQNLCEFSSNPEKDLKTFLDLLWNERINNNE